MATPVSASNPVSQRRARHSPAHTNIGGKFGSSVEEKEKDTALRSRYGTTRGPWTPNQSDSRSDETKTPNLVRKVRYETWYSVVTGVTVRLSQESDCALRMTAPFRFGFSVARASPRGFLVRTTISEPAPIAGIHRAASSPIAPKDRRSSVEIQVDRALRPGLGDSNLAGDDGSAAPEDIIVI